MRTLALVAILAAGCSGGGSSEPAWSADLVTTHPQLLGRWRADSLPGEPSLTVFVTVAASTDPGRFTAHVVVRGSSTATLDCNVRAAGDVVDLVEPTSPFEFRGRLRLGRIPNEADAIDGNMRIPGDPIRDQPTFITLINWQSVPLLIEDHYALPDTDLFVRYEIRR